MLFVHCESLQLHNFKDRTNFIGYVSTSHSNFICRIITAVFDRETYDSQLLKQDQFACSELVWDSHRFSNQYGNARAEYCFYFRMFFRGFPAGTGQNRSGSDSNNDDSPHSFWGSFDWKLPPGILTSLSIVVQTTFLLQHTRDHQSEAHGAWSNFAE